MAQPGVPSDTSDDEIALPCGETITPNDLHLGMREFRCDCGATHAVVMDPHPPTRFLPASVTEVLADTVSPEGADVEEFDTIPLMGLVMEDYAERIVAHDASEDGSTGFALAWIANFDARRLHEVVVETVLEIMANAVTAAGDESAASAFTEQRAAFDVEEFVDAYRAERDFDDEWDEPV